MRNLLIFILILVGVWWVRRALTRPRDGDGAPGARRRSLNEPERMVACAHCGVHVPESEVVREGEAVYCCEEHRRLGVRH